MPTTMPTTSDKTSLPKDIFGLKVDNHELLKRAYHAYLANGRSAHARSKTRGLISGGGRKPWQQKGTGRARVGSSRNPIWRGGGIVFGPTGNENHSISVPARTKRLAIKQALSLANQAKKVQTIASLPKTDGKTKAFVAWLDKQKVSRRVLLVISNLDQDLVRASQNVSNIELKQANYLNVFDILNSDYILIEKAAVAALETWLIEGDKVKVGATK